VAWADVDDYGLLTLARHLRARPLFDGVLQRSEQRCKVLEVPVGVLHCPANKLLWLETVLVEPGGGPSVDKWCA